MQAVEFVNQFLIYTLLWLTLIPIIYILAIKNKATFVDNIIFIIASVAISLILILFCYTLLANTGLITLVASISSILANITIILLIMLAPVLVVTGHYKLEHYSDGEGDS